MQRLFLHQIISRAAEFLWHGITERGCRISAALLRSYKELQNFCRWHQIISRFSEFLRHPSICSWDTTTTIIIKVIHFIFFFGHAPHCRKEMLFLTNELAKKAEITILSAWETTRPGLQAGASWVERKGYIRGSIARDSHLGL